MEQSTGKQGFTPSWPPSCSSEASTQSASSAIISPVCETQCESSAQTDTSPLKEHDYIGLAEISSTASFNKTEQNLHVHDANEPDLRLGLGPSAAKRAVGDIAMDPPCKILCSSQSHVPEVVYNIAHMHRQSSSTCSTSSTKRPDVKLMCSIVTDPYAKSAKRSFSDTVIQAIPDVQLVARVNTGDVAGEDMKPGAMLTMGQVRMMMQMPDVDTKPLSKHPQMVYWAAPRTSSWHPELAHTTGSYGQAASRKPGDVPRVPKNNPDCMPPNSNLVIRDPEPTPDEAPPAKEQVVGWPPVRSYRRSAIAARSSRPCENEGDAQSAIFVKVNMDGIPIGRKVDLNAYKSYEELLLFLEGMFHNPHIGESMRFLHARDFVLTYEDKEGDWMLVGDVPWSMFVNTVKRLRIIRGSDSSCLGSSTSKNLA